MFNVLADENLYNTGLRLLHRITPAFDILPTYPIKSVGCINRKNILQTLLSPAEIYVSLGRICIFIFGYALIHFKQATAVFYFAHWFYFVDICDGNNILCYFILNNTVITYFLSFNVEMDVVPSNFNWKVSKACPNLVISLD